MIDALRGVAIFLAVVALALALRLAAHYLVLTIRRPVRGYLLRHILLMAAAFSVQAGIGLWVIIAHLGGPADWRLVAYPVAHALTIGALWALVQGGVLMRGKHTPAAARRKEEGHDEDTTGRGI